MKKQSFNIGLFTSISDQEMAVLTVEVKEIIAFDFTGKRPANFTTTDLWNIQRQSKTRNQRRYL